MTVYIVKRKKEGSTIYQWLILVCQSQEEASKKMANRNDLWVSDCRDWLPEELDAGRRSLSE